MTTIIQRQGGRTHLRQVVDHHEAFDRRTIDLHFDPTPGHLTIDVLAAETVNGRARTVKGRIVLNPDQIATLLADLGKAAAR